TLLQQCQQRSLSIAELTLRREAALSGNDPTAITERMLAHYRAMRESIRRGLALESRSMSGLSGGDAARLLRYAQGGHPLLGAAVARTAAYGFAVLEHNAQFGRIVATPTAGAAGVVPACLVTLEETRGVTEAVATRGLFTAAGIGVVIGARAPFS